MRKNEEQYFNQLYTESYPLLKRYVFCKAAQNEAEDILQETYYYAYQNIHILIKHPNPMGWLMLTCKNIIYKHLQKNRKHSEYVVVGDCEDILQNVPTMDNYDSIYLEELKNILSDDEYFLLVKKYVEGYSVEELAKQLNITDGACKMRLKRAKKAARRKIGRFMLLLLFTFVEIGGMG